MTILRIGSVIRDNNHRVINRVKTVRRFMRFGRKTDTECDLESATHVIVSGVDGRRTRIAISRIYTDDKSRRSGWSLVKS